MIARLGMVLYWMGLGIASLCEIAAIAVFVISITNGHSASDAAVPTVIFAFIGGLAWLVGRAAKYVLAGI
jgi:hypothetical protein